MSDHGPYSDFSLEASRSNPDYVDAIAGKTPDTPGNAKRSDVRRENETY